MLEKRGAGLLEGCQERRGSVTRSPVNTGRSPGQGAVTCSLKDAPVLGMIITEMS